jgi:hypothetical protein
MGRSQLVPRPRLWPGCVPAPQICRCLPFIQRLHKMEEMVSLRELRAIVKEKFKEYKDVEDGRVRGDCRIPHRLHDWPNPHTLRPFSITATQVVDMLIFKGREEIEVGGLA